MRSDDVRDPSLLVKHELIGLQVEVISASDPTLVGLKGRIVDETRNTLTIEGSGRERMIPKRGSVFRFEVGGKVDVEGERILFRPEDRIKRA